MTVDLDPLEREMLEAVACRRTDGHSWAWWTSRRSLLTDDDRVALKAIEASGLITKDLYLTEAGEALIAPDEYATAEQEPLL